jgi:hypothetical protein
VHSTASAAAQEECQRQRQVVRELEQQLLRRLDLVDSQAAEIAGLQDQVRCGPGCVQGRRAAALLRLLLHIDSGLQCVSHAS